MNALAKSRIESIDLLKGLVIVIMALDHTRDFYFQSPGLIDVTDPSANNLPLYLTRWITHFCAPTFSFLAGLSAFMVGKKKPKNELASFLIKRGLWLVFLDFTVIAFVWYFDIHFGNVDFDVIGSLGISMIALAGLIYMPRKVILIFSLLLIFGHNLLDSIHFEGNIWWSILHEFSSFKITNLLTYNIVYPLIPWIGVMSLGYCFGSFYEQPFDSNSRKKLFNFIGIAAIVFFVLLRWVNVYGDLNHWKNFETSTQTMMSFFNVNKYPPSLLYLCATLGVALLFLANSEKWKGKVVDYFTVFGRVPFFFYIIHLYFIHISAAVVAELTGYGWEIMVQSNFDPDLKNFGFTLPIVYLIWIVIILILYPLCKKFDLYKQNHKEIWWLSYL